MKIYNFGQTKAGFINSPKSALRFPPVQPLEAACNFNRAFGLAGIVLRQLYHENPALKQLTL